MSDYNFLMESRLSPEQLQVVGHVSRAAVEQGLNLYLVGGAVRDLTYGQPTVHDLDFVTEGNPQRILRYLESNAAPSHRPATTPAPAGERPHLQVHSMEINDRYSSAEVQFSNDVRIEISMSRSEVYSKPGRPPEVSPAMIFDDLKRRDFSSNAMAVSLHPNSRGLLLDPTNGAADIEKHELRVLHGRSFSEDPTRIYRLLRLGLRLGFKPEERTRAYLEAALENKLWERLDPEQQGRELQAILREENPGRVLKVLADRGLLSGLDKKLASYKIPTERFAKIRAVCQTVPGSDPYLLNFHCLVQNFSAEHKTRLARKIIGNNKTIQVALGLERAAKKLSQGLASSKNALPSRTYRLLTGEPQELLLYLLAYHPQTKTQNRIKNFLHKVPLVRARLPRAELQGIGMKTGPKFEKILEQVFFDQLDGKIKTPQQLIKELRALSGIKEPPPPPPPKPLKPVKPPKATVMPVILPETEKSTRPPQAVGSGDKPKQKQKPGKAVVLAKRKLGKPTKKTQSKKTKKVKKKKPKR